jgi:CheY-like chemotaxis protein
MVQAASTNRLTVLLADEPDGSAATIGRLLEPQGVETIVAHSGPEALDILKTHPVHVAVLDVQMPQLGGLQVIRLMRALASPPPAILLADNMSNYLLREALGMQVFSVLPKPVQMNALLDAVARVLRRYHDSRWPSHG